MQWLLDLITKHTKDGVLDVDALTKEVNTEFPKHAVPKSDFNTLNDTKKDLEDQIKDRDKQLKDLGEKVKGNDEAEKTIKELQEANKKTKDEYEAKVKELKIDAAIQSKLSDAKYPELLAGRIDKTKLSLSDDGTVLGIDEQVIKLKDTYKDQFKPAVTGGDPENKDKTPPGGKNPWSKEHFNLTEQGRLLRENSALAAQYKAAAGVK